MRIADTFERHPAGVAMALAVVLRMAWLLLAALGASFPSVASFGGRVDHPPAGFLLTHLAELFIQADAAYYEAIATRGYDGQNELTAFFPLLPATVALIHAMVPLPLPWLGLALCNLLDIGGFGLLGRLARDRLGGALGLWCMVLFAISPSRSFGFSFYTEGLYLFLGAAAFLAFESKHVATAVACGALASATRPPGVLVGAALGLDALASRLRSKALSWPQVASFALCACGLLFYMLHLHITQGDALLFLRAQANWKRAASWPLQAWFFDLYRGHLNLHWFSATTAMVLVVMMLRDHFKPRPGKYTPPLRDVVFSGLSILVPLASGSMQSFTRFAGIVFPLYLYAAARLRPRSRASALVVAVLAANSIVIALQLGAGVIPI